MVFGDNNIFGLALGRAYVAYLGRSGGVRGRGYMGVIYVNRWGRRVEE